MSSVRWRKSSYSNTSGGECVELASLGAVRDSKNPSGPMLAVGQDGFREFVTAAKAGRLDHS